MKAAAFFVAEIVPFVVGDQVDNRAVRQRRRFVENQTPFLDASTERAHVDTVRPSTIIGKLTDAFECHFEFHRCGKIGKQR
jgi:hypothetical protein